MRGLGVQGRARHGEEQRLVVEHARRSLVGRRDHLVTSCSAGVAAILLEGRQLEMSYCSDPVLCTQLRHGPLGTRTVLAQTAFPEAASSCLLSAWLGTASRCYDETREEPDDDDNSGNWPSHRHC